LRVSKREKSIDCNAIEYEAQQNYVLGFYCYTMNDQNLVAQNNTSDYVSLSGLGFQV
jgi:hypothetical protein